MNIIQNIDFKIYIWTYNGLLSPNHTPIPALALGFPLFSHAPSVYTITYPLSVIKLFSLLSTSSVDFLALLGFDGPSTGRALISIVDLDLKYITEKVISVILSVPKLITASSLALTIGLKDLK